MHLIDIGRVPRIQSELSRLLDGEDILENLCRGNDMFYVNNVPGWERGLRVAGGVVVSGYALWSIGGL